MIEQRFGDRDVLFDCDYEYRLAPDYDYDYEYEYEYGVAGVHRVRVLKTDSTTQDDRLSETELLTAFRERRQRHRTGFRKSRTKAWQSLSCAHAR